MNDIRAQRQDQTTYEAPAGPALFKAALRGAISAARGVIEGEILVRQARDDREKQIAEINHRNKLQESREAQLALNEAQLALSGRKQDHIEGQDALKTQMTQEMMEEGEALIEQMVTDDVIPENQAPFYRQALLEGKLASLGIDLANVQAQRDEEKQKQQELESRIDALPDDVAPPQVKQLLKVNPEASQPIINALAQSIVEDKQKQTQTERIKTAIFGPDSPIPDNLKPLFAAQELYGINTNALIADELKKASGEKTVPPDLSKLPEAERNLLLQATYRIESKKAAAAQSAYLQFDPPNRKAQLIGLAHEGLGEQATQQINGRWAMLIATQDMIDSLSELKAQGVDLGLLAGSWEQFVQRFGRATSDPRLSEFQNKMLATIQMYRQAMSGAAFTESESREYNRLFPGISTSWDLNVARLKGINDAIKIRLRSDYNILLGPNSSFVYDGIQGVNLGEPIQLPANLALGEPTTQDLKTIPKVVETPGEDVKRNQPVTSETEIPDEHKQKLIDAYVEIAVGNNLNEEQVTQMMPEHLIGSQKVTDPKLIDELVAAVIEQMKEREENNEPTGTDEQ